MSDFRFNCPSCGQHLSGDERYAGLQIVCPACRQTVVVPGATARAAVAIAAMAPPVPGIAALPAPRPAQKTCGLATTSLICSIGTVLVGPFGFIPGIICGHMARKRIAATPGLQGGGMALAGLIIGYLGLASFVLLVLLVGSSVLVFFRGVKQMQQGGMPGATVTITDSASGPAAEGDTTDTEPDGSGWMMKLAGATFPTDPVTGRIHGQPFKMEKVTLENGWLDFRQGTGFFADREIDVVVFENDPAKLSGRTFTVPKKEFGGSPHIWMKWKEAGEDTPKQRSFMDRYAMRLEFGMLSGGNLPGKIYLCIPDKDKSFIAGTFEAEVKK